MRNQSIRLVAQHSLENAPNFKRFQQYWVQDGLKGRLDDFFIDLKFLAAKKLRQVYKKQFSPKIANRIFGITKFYHFRYLRISQYGWVQSFFSSSRFENIPKPAGQGTLKKSGEVLFRSVSDFTLFEILVSGKEVYFE